MFNTKIPREVTLSAIALCIAVGVFGNVDANNNNDAHLSHVATTSNAIAPTWNLRSVSARTISNRQFAGRPYVLVLHLGKGCLHCAKQLHTFGERIHSFDQAGLEVVAVSTDEPAKLAEQLGDFGNNFAIRYLASDDKLELFRGVGAFDDESQKPLHATLLLDAAGRIRFSDIGEHPFMDVDALISEAKLVSTGSTTVQEDEDPQRPKVFLNKPPRVVDFQLKRLDNVRLLMVSRKTDDKKYVPVWKAILVRAGIDRQYRKQSVKALVELNQSSEAIELIEAMDSIHPDSKGGRAVSRQLSTMLMRLPAEQLRASTKQLTSAADSQNPILRSASYAALIASGAASEAEKTASAGKRRMLDWLNGISMVRDKATRNQLRDSVKALLAKTSDSQLKRAAIRAMKSFTIGHKETFSLLASLLKDNQLRDVAVETMLTIPPSGRDSTEFASISETLLREAEKMPAENRTKPESIAAMQLVDELTMSMPENESAGFKERMSEVSVRVVRMKTVKEEMRYDVPYFAATANRPLQIVLQNDDLMPHNLVICKPGRLKKVAMDGLAAGITGGLDGKQYVPKTKDVLFATDMIQANQTQRLTFKAPSKPGEYPFVCTFPQHWSRMYGVMVVVDDLAAWENNPVKPKDPIGNQRQFVQKWTAADFVNDDEFVSTERSVEAGKRIFTEATCAQCHRLGDFGGIGANVGPSLDDLYLRWKRDRNVVLKHIFDPSDHVDEKYKMYIVATDDGLTRSGLVVSQNDEYVELLESGSISQTTKIARDEIEDMAESKKSIMPKALLDQFTREEILDLMVYLEANQK